MNSLVQQLQRLFVPVLLVVPLRAVEFTRVASGSVATDQGDCTGVAWIDYDNDRHLDLFVSVYGGASRLYRNSGNGSFSRITTGVLVEENHTSLSGVWGDFDNDGFLDLLVANNNGVPNFLFRNGGNLNSWLKVKCVGTRSNRAAIGVKVRVHSVVNGATLWQLREVSGASGYGSQNSLECHFGLGDAATAKIVRIEWPSGIVQEFQDVTANQTLTIHESPVLSAARKQFDGSFEFVLTSRNGLDYRVEYSTNLFQWSELLTHTNVHGSVQTRDTRASASEKRFYRAVQVP